MQELNKILKKEQEMKGSIDALKEEVSKGIQEKKQELGQKLENENLTEKEKQVFLNYKEKRVTEIKTEAKSNLEKEIRELEEKEAINLNKAVDFVIQAMIE